ncbi:MAG TPA: methyltransferase domain-containing protein [Candidatus Dormibacteraeota bacterium]|nr:methyltransferase domain-containing protein [Candidatus Dormibacteraeota bacterium]
MTSARSSRGPFAGVLQIVRYNWNLYVAAMVGAAVVIGFVVATHPPTVLAGLLILGAIAALFWLALSLAVSHYVYDRSDLYRWQWIQKRIAPNPGHVVNIHAGLDETSLALQEIYPAAEVTILDIYDPAEMPEPSIARARREPRAELASVKADFRALPLQAASADLVTVIFVAHELRQPASKEAFFRELARVIKPGGRVLLVEHLRDAWNLLAFGPGAFHFFPRSEWLRVSDATGFRLSEEISRTVFVRALVFVQA